MNTITLDSSFIEIPEKMFYGKNIDIVILPVECKKICRYAFYNSTIKQIIMPGVDTIEDFAFSNCKFTEFDTQNVINIGNSVFSNSRLMMCIVRVPTITTEMFCGCEYLENVVLSPNVKTIEKYAFHNSSIKNINLENVCNIGHNAFENCNIKNVNLWSLSEIQNFTFKNCTELMNVFINAKIIGYCAFENCMSLMELELSENLERVKYGAFMNCRLLKFVEFPDSLKRIDGFAFAKTQLKEINFSKESKLKKLGGHVFMGAVCEDIYLPKRLPKFDDNNVISSFVKKIHIYSTTRYVHTYGFYNVITK